jgi:phosphoribosylformylglycinamidine cyclo-ligase
VDEAELERTFNMGVGMVAVVPPDRSGAALELLAARGLPAWLCGEVRQRRTEDHSDGAPKGGHGGVAQLRGSYSTSAT